MTNLTTQAAPVAQETTNNALSILNVENMRAMQSFSEIMVQGGVSVPDHLKGNLADCLAVTMQALQWGMNPFAVAQKTHIVNGKLGYEAQLINAVISSSTAISGRFKYEYVGDWSKVSRANWKPADENGLGVKVGAVLSGEDSITWGEPVYLATVTTRNSPLWKTQPRQQLAYLAMKYWARLYTPDVTLGVYDQESLEQPIEARKEREINPLNDDLNAMLSDNPPADKKPIEAAPVEPEPQQNNAQTKFEEVKQYISEINDEQSYNSAAAAFNDAANNGLCTPAELQELHDLLVSKAG